MAYSLGHLSLEQANVFFWSKGENRQTLVANAVVLGLGIGTVAAVIAWAIVMALGPSRVPIASESLLIVALASVPVQMVLLFLSGLLILADRIHRVYLGNLFGAIAMLAGTLGLAAFDMYNLTTLVVLFTVSGAIPLSVYVVTLAPRLRHASRTLARKSVALGAKYHLGMAALFLLWRFDVLLLNSYVSETQVGLYSMAVAIAELVYLLTDTVAQVALPRQVVGSLEESGRLTARVAGGNAVLACLLLTITCICAPFVVPLVLGSSFSGSVPALLALAPGVLALAVVRPLGGFIVRINRPFIVSAATGSAMVLNIVINLLLIPPLGIVGASLASTIAYGLLAIFYVVWVRRAAKLPLRAFYPRGEDLRRPFSSVVARLGWRG